MALGTFLSSSQLGLSSSRGSFRGRVHIIAIVILMNYLYHAPFLIEKEAE